MFVFPAVMIVFTVIAGTDKNWSGLLSDPRYRLYAASFNLIGAVWLVWVLNELYERFQIPQRKQKLSLLVLLMLLSVLFQYTEASVLFKTLHLLFSYSLFFWLNLCLFDLRWLNRHVTGAYILLSALSFGLVLIGSSVTALSECVYVCTVSVLLSILLQ